MIAAISTPVLIGVVIVILVIIGIICYFVFGSKYYIVKVITEEKRFVRFDILGVKEREKRRVIKNGDGKYLMRVCGGGTFADCVTAADFTKVCFKSKSFAKQVVGNLLTKRKPSTAASKAKPAPPSKPKPKRPPKTDEE